MRKLILNLHLYSALLAGLFLITLGLTGSVMVFDNDLDRLLHPHLLKVHSTGPVLPVSAILQSLAKTYPGQRFGSMHLPIRADDPYSTNMKDTQVLIDSHTGQILGTRPQRTIFAPIHELHTNLMLHVTGHYMVMIATFFLPLLVISGIYLWWPLKIAKVRRGKSLRQTLFDLHIAAGIYSALFLLVLGLTGIALSLDGWWVPKAYAMTHSAAPQRWSKSTTPPGTKISPDQAISAACTALPGAAPIYVLFPSKPDSAYQVMMRFPEDLTPGGRSWVNVDQFGGNILMVNSSRHLPAVTTAIMVNRGLHTGDIYGYPTKFLMSLSSLMLVFQTITGYYLWWKKLRRGNNPTGLAASAASAQRDST